MIPHSDDEDASIDLDASLLFISLYAWSRSDVTGIVPSAIAVSASKVWFASSPVCEFVSPGRMPGCGALPVFWPNGPGIDDQPAPPNALLAIAESPCQITE